MVETQKKQWNTVASEITFSLEPDLNSLTRRIDKQARILDYGCGYGRIAQALHASGYARIIGTDTSTEMIKRGQADYPTLDLRHMEDHHIPAELGKFDVVLLCAVLTCIPQQQQRASVLQAVHDALNPGGMLYCVEFQQSAAMNYSPAGCFTSKFGVDMKHFLPSEIAEEMSLFEAIDQFTANAATLSGGKTRAIHYFGRKRSFDIG